MARHRIAGFCRRSRRRGSRWNWRRACSATFVEVKYFGGPAERDLHQIVSGWKAGGAIVSLIVGGRKGVRPANGLHAKGHPTVFAMRKHGHVQANGGATVVEEHRAADRRAALDGDIDTDGQT